MHGIGRVPQAGGLRILAVGVRFPDAPVTLVEYGLGQASAEIGSACCEARREFGLFLVAVPRKCFAAFLDHPAQPGQRRMEYFALGRFHWRSLLASEMRSGAADHRALM